ncbi:MAG: dTMP kinase [Chloroflexi bacterium]|nr:dTMP kinase [Chloroflexota bacterium]
MAGRFIVFEGGEGSGKTTQVRALRRRLIRRGYSVVVAREPGGTPGGEAIRRLLRSSHTLSPRVELFLFAASRALLVDQVIRPALAEGRIVICDRFSASTIAYQGYGRELGASTAAQISDMATGGLAPDLTVYMDVAPELGLQRKAGVPDRFERAHLEFHRRVREGYLAQARLAPELWLMVDASLPPRQVSRQVWSRVGPWLDAERG